MLVEAAGEHHDKNAASGFGHIVDISGRIVLGEECTSFGKLVRELLVKAHTSLNLSVVHRIDTAGLAYIMSGLTQSNVKKSVVVSG